jgi:hypothetical protein
VYKHYIPDIFVPLYWDDKLLEFDTKDAAEDFLAVAKDEVGLELDDVVVKNVAHFNTKDEILNATYLRVCAGDDYDFLYDIRED